MLKIKFEHTKESGLRKKLKSNNSVTTTLMEGMEETEQNTENDFFLKDIRMSTFLDPEVQDT